MSEFFKLTDINGKIHNPIELASCHGATGDMNLRVVTLVDDIVKGFGYLSDFPMENSVYKGMPSNLADLPALADWLENVSLEPLAAWVKSVSQRLLPGDTPIQAEQVGDCTWLEQYVIPELAANLRRLQYLADFSRKHQEDRENQTEFHLDAALEKLKNEGNGRNFDTIFLSYRKFQGDLLAPWMNWSMVTECFRRACESGH